MRATAPGLALLCWLCLACGPAEPPPVDAVVVIAVDTLRADHLGAYGYARPTSPAFDRWSEGGRLYERAFAPSPWTLPSFASLLTGQIPARHAAGEIVEPEDARRVLRLDAGLRTLPEILAEHGFTTAAIANNVFLAPQFGLARGFQDYDFVFRSERGGRRADEVTRLALRWIDLRAPERFFLFVHYMDPHMGYDAPAGFRGRFTAPLQARSALRHPVSELWGIRSGQLALSDADQAFVAAAYDEEIAFVDSQVERLRAGLEARGLLERALVVFTSDHGEKLFEHGGFEHGHALWQQLVHVPLVFWGPGVTPGREDGAVSLVDLAPTLLEAAGVAPSDAMAGISLWPNLRRAEAIPGRLLTFEQTLWGPSRIAALRWPHKFESLPELGRNRLFDLVADPAESENFGPRRPAVRRQLQRALETRLQQARALRAPPEEARMDPETEARLRSLGYIE